MTIEVGEVIAVNGIKITLKIYEESSKDTLFYKGEKYNGVSIREYITIQRGFRDIICIIEGEYLDEKRFEENGSKLSFIRKVEAKPIGYFEQGSFYEGIKFLPMIKDVAYLLKESRLNEIYSKGYSGEKGFTIGKMLKEEIPISLPWKKLFNSHIGIFGNTGSGKSNTLAKLYTVLFTQKLERIRNKSQFIILDFNGEYTSDQLIDADHKTTLHLNTQVDGSDKFPLSSSEFWNPDTLSILFQATPNTQRPFLNRLINGRKRYLEFEDSLKFYIQNMFKSVFSAASPKPETLDLLRAATRIINNKNLLEILKNISWHGKQNTFFIPSAGIYFNSDGEAYTSVFENDVQNIEISGLTALDELVLRAHLQLIGDLIHGYVQFDHIQPLIKRIESSLSSLSKVITISNDQENQNIVTVISLRKCNQEMTKILPLLIAMHYYHLHKEVVSSPPNKTMHLVIDEAHTILSQQSSSEQESWKDYRLELFEEIIKEGRKFGMFVTLASQRPADISPTIVSQVHNFFIHRLVNERDLYLLDNTISTLDHISRSLIPNLSTGSCVVTGTSFDLPMVIQVDRLELTKRPDSEDINLETLWSDE
tara:strand:- start:6456 stop:8234 length:1779 start_codon:yes stop_codon:yes gene_type:complete